MGENKLSFEEAMERLEEIVEQLETGGISLAESLEKFEEGVKLIKLCNKELNKAEKKVEMVLQEEEGYGEAVPFAEHEDE